MWFLGIRLRKSALAFDKVNEFEIHFLSDVFVAVAVAVAVAVVVS